MYWQQHQLKNIQFRKQLVNNNISIFLYQLLLLLPHRNRFGKYHNHKKYRLSKNELADFVSINFFQYCCRPWNSFTVYLWRLHLKKADARTVYLLRCTKYPKKNRSVAGSVKTSVFVGCRMSDAKWCKHFLSGLCLSLLPNYQSVTYSLHICQKEQKTEKLSCQICLPYIHAKQPHRYKTTAPGIDKHFNCSEYYTEMIHIRELGCFSQIFWPKIRQLLSNSQASDWTFKTANFHLSVYKSTKKVSNCKATFVFQNFVSISRFNENRLAYKKVYFLYVTF